MIKIIILGIIQGITEFIPVSSSAHLLVFRELFNLGSGISDELSRSFDIALHLGTLLAIVIFFFKDFLKIIKDGLNRKKIKTKKGKILWHIVIATIPAAIFGFLLDDYVEDLFRNNYFLVASSLIVVAIIILLIDKYSKSSKKVEDLTYQDSFKIGLAQAFSIIPGVSRSGSTIAASRAIGLNGEEAAKFSFYLAAPIILGASILDFVKIDLALLLDHALVFVVGTLTSFIVGILVIKYILNYLKTHDFKIFMYYRILFAIVIIIKVLFF